MSKKGESGRSPRGDRRRVSRIPASDLLDVEVTLAAPPGHPTITKALARPLLGAVERFKADPIQVAQAVQALSSLGFRVTAVSPMSISAKVPRGKYEEIFGTKLSKFSQPLVGPSRPTAEGSFDIGNAAAEEFFFPPEGASWEMPLTLAELIDDAYIQWPPIYFENPFPPVVSYLD